MSNSISYAEKIAYLRNLHDTINDTKDREMIEQIIRDLYRRSISDEHG